MSGERDTLATTEGRPGTPEEEEVGVGPSVIGKGSGKKAQKESQSTVSISPTTPSEHVETASNAS